MSQENNKKRIDPPLWQHDYHVLRRLYESLQDFTKRYLAKDKKKKLLVDYGCGTLPYKKLFTPFTFCIIGVDIGNNPDADILVKEEESIPIEDKKIDIILSTQVIEHVRNVTFYLSECSRLLKKNGLLFLSTHGIWPYHGFPDDYHRWTKKGLEEEIKRAGFSLLEIKSVLGPFAASCQFNLLLLAEKFKKRGQMVRIILALISVFGNGMIWVNDKAFPGGKTSDASLFVLCAKKK